MKELIPSGQNPKDLTTFERIRLSYVSDEFELTEKEVQIKERWFRIFCLMSAEFNTTFDVINILDQEFGLSRAQAFRDINNAEKLFGKVREGSKEGEKRVFLELGMAALREAYKSKDLDAFAKIYASIGKFQGYDKEELDLPNWKDRRPLQFNITIDPDKAGLPHIENVEAVVEKFLKTKKAKDLEIPDADIVGD